MNIKLYIPSGPGSDNIRRIVSEVVADVANRMGVSIANLVTVAIADKDQYGEAVADLFKNGTFTNNEAYVGVAKADTEFIKEIPKHTILFRDYVFDLILCGLSISETLSEWPPEYQSGLYIISHELGHCKDAEVRRLNTEERSLSLANGFDLKKINEYYYSVFVNEFCACLCADNFYSLEHLKCEASHNFKSISKMQSDTMYYRKNYDEDDQIFQVAIHSSGLIWTYLIQYGKLWAGKRNADFEDISIPNIIEYEFTNPAIQKMLDAFLDCLASSYPDLTDGALEQFLPIWHAVSLHIGYKFEYEEGTGWACYWN